MQASISNIIEYGPDLKGKGFFGFVVVYSPLIYKNHIYEYDQDTRHQIYSQVTIEYQSIEEEITQGEHHPKGEKK